MIACRKSFTDTLLSLARMDKDIIAVTTDARGSVTLNDFAKELPQQFVECGIAEQDAVGISAGLVPMVADMSSDIFSRPIDVSKYICIYGGAQKNLAPAGVTFVIVKNDALGKVSRYIPTMLNYQTHVDSGSMFNTPPVVPIYAALQTLRWIKAQGGVKEMERRAIEKADMLYAEIDRNKMFVGTAAKEDRSRMNICFVMAPEYKDFEADFLKFATERGMVGIKGHRSVGGFRASCYNALPKESVQALIDCMQEFEKLH